MAVANYQDVYGCYPPPYLAGPDGRPWHSWRVLLLPYLDHADLYQAYDFEEPWNGPHNRRLAERMPRLYQFHTLDRPGNTVANYLVVVGEETAWPGTRTVTPDEVTDGVSDTILLVENAGGVHWMEPRDLTWDELDPAFNSAAGVSSPYDTPGVALLDGSLRTLRPSISPAVLRAMLTIGGGERLTRNEQGDYALLPDGRMRPLRK